MSRSAALLAVSLCCLTIGCVDSNPDGGLFEQPIGAGGVAANDAEEGGNGEQSAGGPCGEAPALGGPVVQAYLATWTDLDAEIADLDWSTLTHVAVAFANPTPEGVMRFSEDDDYNAEIAGSIATLVEQAHQNSVEVVISLGGAHGSGEARAQLGEDQVDAFVEELARFVDEYGFDGVDVDLEGSEAVDETYVPFVQKLTARLRPEGKIVTAAVAEWYAHKIQDDALFCFDFINIMSYDRAGWGGVVGDHSSMEDARADLNYWTLTRGYPKERTVLGLPFYGYCFGSACPGTTPERDYSQVTYATITEMFPDQADSDWIEADGMQMSLNGPATIAAKTELALGYGGVMIWEISQDTSDNRLFSSLAGAAK